MTAYSIGFCFNQDRRSVVLIRKKRPEWQAGRLNGVGGKIEKYELPIYAMVREFLEETGVETQNKEWRHFATMRGIDWQKDHQGLTNAIVYCFELASDTYFEAAQTREEEQIIKLNIAYVPVSEKRLWIPNLSVLIPLACSTEFEYPTDLIWSRETQEREA